MKTEIKRIIRKVRKEQVASARDRLVRERDVRREFVASLNPGDRVTIRGFDIDYYVYNVVAEAIGNPVLANESEYFVHLVPVDVDTNPGHDYVLIIGHMDSLISKVSLVKE